MEYQRQEVVKNQAVIEAYLKIAKSKDKEQIRYVLDLSSLFELETELVLGNGTCAWEWNLCLGILGWHLLSRT